MIRINLLGQERPKATGRAIPLEATLRGVLLLVAVVLAFVVLYVVYHQKSQELVTINQKITNLEAERARLQVIKAQVDQFEKEKAVLQQRIDVIEELQANRSGGQQLLQMVANTVGRTDQLWLTSLSRKGNALDIDGEAASISAIANFITQMRRSGYFVKIDIKEAHENDIVKGLQTFAFTMSAEVSQPKAVPGPAPSGGRPGKS